MGACAAPWSGKAGAMTVELHPSRVLADMPSSSYEHPFLVYHEKVRTSKVFVRDATIVSAFPLLLFGKDVQVLHLESSVVLDGWLRLGVAAHHAVLVQALRGKLQQILA